MKHSESKVLLVIAAVAGLFFFAGTAQAQTCTLDNWSAKVGESNLSVGTQGSNNRRYAGPCGLRVALAGSAAHLTDNSPTAETVFNVRFYFFLNEVAADVTIFEALDSGDNSIITATYDHSADAVNVVFTHAGGTETVAVSGVSTGWNSLEIQWEAKATEQPVVTVANASGTDSAGSAGEIDTSALTIDTAKLGALSAPAATPTGGSIDFDDYDSRRDTVPGRLVRGDANGDGTLNIFDVVSGRNQILGNSVANGQPDCNENGSIDIFDIVCMRRTILGL